MLEDSVVVKGSTCFQKVPAFFQRDALTKAQDSGFFLNHFSLRSNPTNDENPRSYGRKLHRLGIQAAL